jgi:hypothetical protein
LEHPIFWAPRSEKLSAAAAFVQATAQLYVLLALQWQKLASVVVRLNTKAT